MSLARNYATRYQEMEVQNSDPFELVLLLYNAALKDLKLAKRHMELNEIEPKVSRINKASAIIGELKACLDFEKGGQLSYNLDRLYSYMLIRLAEANIKNDTQRIDEIGKLMHTLLSGWEEARKSTSQEPTTRSAPKPDGVTDRLTLQSGRDYPRASL